MLGQTKRHVYSVPRLHTRRRVRRRASTLCATHRSQHSRAYAYAAHERFDSIVAGHCVSVSEHTARDGVTGRAGACTSCMLICDASAPPSRCTTQGGHLCVSGWRLQRAGAVACARKWHSTVHSLSRCTSELGPGGHGRCRHQQDSLKSAGAAVKEPHKFFAYVPRPA